jgi:hypothetical protein
MCPIYKKKDVRDIANYRPITILNTDYKIFTKALSTKLSEVASKLIHEDQAGFLPGRSIFDQVKLSKLIIDYAEATGNDGIIVALDQEKAYDKIAHDYLWKTLEKFALPQPFIKTIQHLYEKAETVVIINGVISTPFRVTQGVHQGDPLSCLLFDLAIEPLAAMLRNSNLKGIQIPGVMQRQITTLFADDTTVYLDKTDNFLDLQNILQDWCQVSGAKFNISKTEIIPIGSPAYRTSVIESQKTNTMHNPITDEIHIAKDGEPTRVLGAWIGNKIDQAEPWTTILEKIDKNLNQWSKSHPTTEGKQLIVQMVVAGMTQYLTKVQGMPQDIEKRLIKKICTFIWGHENTPPIGLPILSSSISEGGKKVLDLSARNKAIHLTWLKSYLELGPKRPLWAFVADALINKRIPNIKSVDNVSQINIFLQNWNTKPNARSHLPKDLTDML